MVEGADGDRVYVREHGAKEGGLRFAWVLECRGIKLLIADRQDSTDTQCNVIVQIGSVALMERGHVAAWLEAARLLTGWGYQLDKAVPSRVDLCVDLAGVGVGEFVQRFLADHIVCRGREWDLHGSGRIKDTTGFHIGNELRLRVYDKLRELRKSGDETKLGLLVNYRWGGLPEAATRVEFQIRRRVLREQFSIETVADLFGKLGSICEWLTTEWARLTDGVPDRENGHEKRAAVLPLWQRVQQAFAAWCGSATAPVQPRERRNPQAKNLFMQALGCLGSAAAVLGDVPATVESFGDWIAAKVREQLTPQQTHDVFFKWCQFHAAGRAGPQPAIAGIPF